MRKNYVEICGVDTSTLITPHSGRRARPRPRPRAAPASRCGQTLICTSPCSLSSLVTAPQDTQWPLVLPVNSKARTIRLPYMEILQAAPVTDASPPREGGRSPTFLRHVPRATHGFKPTSLSLWRLRTVDLALRHLNEINPSIHLDNTRRPTNILRLDGKGHKKKS